MRNKVWYLPKFQNSGKLPESTKKTLQNIGKTILDFTPIVGDIKGLTVDPYKAYKEDGLKAGLKMMGLGLLTLIPGTDVLKLGKQAGKVLDKAQDASKQINTIKGLRTRDNTKTHPLSIKILEKEIKEKEKEKVVTKLDSKGNPINFINPKTIALNKIGNKDFNLQDIINKTNLNYYVKQDNNPVSLMRDKNFNIQDRLSAEIADFKTNDKDTMFGIYYPNENKFFLNRQNKYLLPAAMHESGHHLFKLGYWDRYNPYNWKILDDGYQVLSTETSDVAKIAKDISEKFAENQSYRLPTLYRFIKKYGDYPRLDQIQQFIKDTSNEKILEDFNTFVERWNTDYGNAYKNFLAKHPEQVEQMKDAWIYIWDKGGKIDENN